MKENFYSLLEKEEETLEINLQDDFINKTILSYLILQMAIVKKDYKSIRRHCNLQGYFVENCVALSLFLSDNYFVQGYYYDIKEAIETLVYKSRQYDFYDQEEKETIYNMGNKLLTDLYEEQIPDKEEQLANKYVVLLCEKVIRKQQKKITLEEYPSILQKDFMVFAKYFIGNPTKEYQKRKILKELSSNFNKIANIKEIITEIYEESINLEDNKVRTRN